jgi:hypothetical protein
MVSNNPIVNGNGIGGNGRTEETAAQAYAGHLRNVAAMLDWVQAELEAHQEKHRASPGNWGLVGDLAEAEALAKAAARARELLGSEPDRRGAGRAGLVALAATTPATLLGP